MLALSMNLAARDAARMLARNRIRNHPPFSMFRFPCTLSIRYAGRRNATHCCNDALARTSSSSATGNMSSGVPVKSADFGRADLSAP